MERRGRIPVAKFRTQEGKTRSRSRVREPDYNEQDPETDLFTLLEDNIALKEDNKALKAGIEDYKKVQNELLEENSKLKEELESLRRSQSEFEVQIKDMAVKLAKTTTEKSALDKLHKMKVEQVNLLTTQLQSLRENQDNLSVTLEDSLNLKSKILKIIPSLANNEMESLIDIEDPKASKITGECIEKLIDEFVQLKNTLNSVELQLYEANEKISDLMENQHHLEEENESLRSENSNLTKVAQLLTQNMKESVQTSKKMEEALIKLKQRNDELTKQSKDLLDGQTTLPSTPTDPVTPITTTTIESAEAPEEPIEPTISCEQAKDEIPNPSREQGERIVEMKSLMDAAIEKNTNDELKTIHVRLEILEVELKKALARAEKAESALETYKRQKSFDSKHASTRTTALATVTVPLLPPPPPPPLPNLLLYSPNNSVLHRKLNVKNTNSNSSMLSSSHTASFCHIHSSQNELEACGSAGGQATANSDSLCCSCKQMKQQVGAATGLDALVRELKSGKVTLRRNRRKTRTNEALQEMFQVLEISRKQNRNSQIIIDIHT